MSNLKISFVQFNIAWENPEHNKRKIELLIEQEQLSTDVLVLPEMFTTGFSMNAAQFAEPVEGISTQWMKYLSKKLNCLLIGSLMIQEEGRFFNRLLAVFPEGKVLSYDKRHLFRLAKEDNVYQQGAKRLIFQYKGWWIFPQICYDLRFPIFSRNPFSTQAYDLAIYVANWPEKRGNAWRTLLPARAIENLCYVVGVNRVGVDPNNNEHRGDSMIVDYTGEILVQMTRGEGIETLELDYEKLMTFRRYFPAWKDADDFQIDIPTDRAIA